MKNYYLNPPSQPEVNYMDSLFAEMILEKALLDFQKDNLLKEIDQSLKESNKEEFLRLTEELKRYLK
ncbi:IDEAL domain-containing protein [Bacillus sp. CGMCC 1.16607]|uniref:IDEAL domain-containing protein n=1 Tax=Bacillus sp. CGMCC 1.16607 TaxID=3351842 RepID=UPI003638244B